VTNLFHPTYHSQPVHETLIQELNNDQELPAVNTIQKSREQDRTSTLTANTVYTRHRDTE
jgi:hypothetical protein